jgi:hypothetical protein
MKTSSRVGTRRRVNAGLNQALASRLRSSASVSSATLPKPGVDNWLTSAWTRRSPAIGKLPALDGDDHFD